MKFLKEYTFLIIHIFYNIEALQNECLANYILNNNCQMALVLILRPKGCTNVKCVFSFEQIILSF